MNKPTLDGTLLDLEIRLANSQSDLREPEPPKCHFTYMFASDGDNGDGTSVEFYECKHCGHTKLIRNINHNAN